MRDQAELCDKYSWRLGPGHWTPEELAALGAAGAALEAWLALHAAGPEAARAAIRRVWGGTTFRHTNAIGRVLRRNHTEAGCIYFFGPWYARGDPRHVPVHELAHVLDNRSRPAKGPAGPWLLRDADMYGGGVADVLARRLGGAPERCLLRFFCRRPWSAGYREPPLTEYGHMGPSEDFADTFALAVLRPERLAAGSVRAAFMEELARALAGEATAAEAPLRWLAARHTAPASPAVLPPPSLPREQTALAGEGARPAGGDLPRGQTALAEEGAEPEIGDSDGIKV